ncbi:MAG TPA: AtpZ/AtpI family protein [Myxococcales bacterium]|nr:AtpZ/AtpI family protein [Myxococcales bacterium]
MSPSRRPTKEERRNRRQALRLSTVGLELGVAVGLGGYAGYWLDGRFDTRPVWTLIMLFLGITAGFLNLIRVVNRLDQSSSKSEPNDSKPSDDPS